MALPVLTQPVSYPDPLHQQQQEIPVGDGDSVLPSDPLESTDDRQDFVSGEEVKDGEDGGPSPYRLPPVVTLKEFGRPTAHQLQESVIKPRWLETSYQKALARVRERIVHQKQLPRNAEEWRYHKAPVPARPDLTRTSLPVLIQNDRSRRRKHRRSETYPKAASDTFEAESRVTFLPPLPVNTLYQNILHDLSSSFPSTLLSKKLKSVNENDPARPTYFPFVGTASLHPKALTETEIREKPYVLPALCPGCRSDVRVTEVKGYVGQDKDEGIGSEVESHEVKGQDGEEEDEEVKLVKEIAISQLPHSVCFGCSFSRTPHYHHSKPRRIGGGFTFFSKEPQKYAFIAKEQAVAKETREPDSSAFYSSENLPIDDDLCMSVEKLPEPLGPVREMTVPREKPTVIPEWILDLVHHHGDENHKAKNYQHHCYACLQILKQLLPDYNPKDRSDCSSSGIGTSIMSEAARLEEESRLEEEARLRMEARAREKQRLEDERLRREEYDRERRKHLYKAPKAFQPKKTESKTTESKDPFSSDRKLDVPKTDGFKVNKSTKSPTKTIETKHPEQNWKEPERFELKKPVPKTTATDRKPPERKERLRPETPPPPPPPPVAKKPTVPIKPKKREEPEQIASLREPLEAPPKKKLEKTKFVKPPVKKVEKEPLPPPPTPPKPVRAKTPPSKKKPVEREKTPPPKPIEAPPRVIEKTKPVVKEKPKPVKKEQRLPAEPPKPVQKTGKVERKPVVVQRDEKRRSEGEPVVKKKQPPKEPKKVEETKQKKGIIRSNSVLSIASYVTEQEEPPVNSTLSQEDEVKKEPAQVKPITPPPPPKDPTPEPPPPKEPTPPPKEPTPPPREATPQPREPTPPPNEPTPPPKETTPPPKEPMPPPREPTPPPREPTPPPRELTPPPPEPEPEPVEIKRQPRPKPQRKKPPKPIKKKTKKKEPEQMTKSARPYMDIPQVPFRQPVVEPEPEPPKEPTPEPEPEPEVEPEPEPEPPRIPTPEPSPPTPPPPKEPEQPAPIIKPSKKTRNAKMPKPAPAKKAIAVKAKKIPEKPKKKSKPFVMPVIQKLAEPEEPPAFPTTPEPVGPIVEPEIEALPAPIPPTPEPAKEPTPEPPPLTPPQSMEPIIMRRRRPKYKPKRRKWRKTEATPTDAGSPEPVMVDALDYLAKYCIVHKQRIPHYQHVFNAALRKKGIQINDTAPPSVPTVANLKAHDNRVAQTTHRGSIKPDPDNISVTTETSGYASGVNDEPTVVGAGDEFVSSFGVSATINEEDYISPMDLTGSGEEDSNGNRVENGAVQPSNFFGRDMFAADDYLDKLAFQLDNLYKKSNTLQLKVLELSDARRRTLADFARNEFPEILRPGYDPKAVGKKSPKGKKAKAGEVKFVSVVEELSYLNPDQDVREEVHPENNDWVLSRLSKSQLQMLESDSSVRRLNLEHERAQEKYDYAQERIASLLDEKARISFRGSTLRQQELLSRNATNEDFRRKQSLLYQKMNPVEDHEVEVSDLEPTLRHVNSYLITEKEAQYVYHVLDLPQRHRIDFKLFTVVAALSEKVSRLEPFIRKLINKMNFEALEVKMQHAKELFFLLADEDDETDGGEVPIRNLVVELKAGGLKPEHVQLVVDKFNRDGKGTVDFLDFLTYIPLFIDIHENIIFDPLNWSTSR